MQAGLMHKYLAVILRADSELAGLLAVLPCILALQELNAVRPAREWSRSAYVSAAEAGHLEVLQWQSDKGIMNARDTAQAAKAAAITGNWEVSSWLLQQFPNDHVWQSVRWPCYALEHIFILPEQHGLLKLKSLDALVGLADVVCSHHLHPSWFAAKAGYISSLQRLQDHRPVCAETSWATQAAAAFGHLDVMHWLRQNGAAWH